MPHRSEGAGARCAAEQWAMVRLMERATEGHGMSPGEITACYRLYAAHRRSNEICVFPEAVLAMNGVVGSAELAVLLACIPALKSSGMSNPKDDLHPAVVGRFGRLRKILVSLAAQFSARGALVGR
jgi:hypothetical protein